jgi:hypothetical protein
MWYNLFRFPSDPAITGLKEGGRQVLIDEHRYQNVDTYEKIKRFFSYQDYWQNWNVDKFFPNFDVEIHGGLITNANLTDFMGFHPSLLSCYFLIHDQVAELFSRFDFPQHQLYQAFIYKNEKVISSSYKLFCSPYAADGHIIDFDKSLFVTGPLTRRVYHKINNWDDFKNFPGSLEVELLSMNKNFDQTVDFYCGRIGGVYFSQRITEAIEQKNFTGIRLLDKSAPQMRILSKV